MQNKRKMLVNIKNRIRYNGRPAGHVANTDSKSLPRRQKLALIPALAFLSTKAESCKTHECFEPKRNDVVVLNRKWRQKRYSSRVNDWATENAE